MGPDVVEVIVGQPTVSVENLCIPSVTVVENASFDLSSYATITYVNNVSGVLAAQIGDRVISLNSLTGHVNLSGVSGIGIYSNGQTIFVSYTGQNSSLTGDYLPFSSGALITNLYNQTGFYALKSNVVSLTGDQLISGIKSFADSINVNFIQDNVGLGNSINLQSANLNTISETTLNWEFKELYGDWFKSAPPTNNLHIVNKLYVDNLTNLYYPRSGNPSGYITSAALSPYATINFVTGISGALQNQINGLTIANIVYQTGDQNISGEKNFFNNQFFKSGTYFGNSFINYSQYDPVISVSRGNDTESIHAGYDGAAPSHGISFYRNWVGLFTGIEGGVYSYSTPNWGGGLVFQVKAGDGIQNGPTNTALILQSDGNVNIGSGLAIEKLRVDGRIQAENGFLSGATNLGDLFYPLDANPSGYITGAQISVGKTLFVDSIFGDDSSAAREVFGKPFLTLTGAREVAAAGDLIKVGGGNYTALTSLFKDGVDWYFDSNAVVTRVHTPTKETATLEVNGFNFSEGTVIINDDFYSYSIDFINTDINPGNSPTPGNGVVYFGGADTDADILAALISALTTGTGVTPSGLLNTPGTAPTYSLYDSGTTLKAHYFGSRSNIRFDSTLNGINIINKIAGSDDYIGLFDDRNGAVICNIFGQGTFIADYSNYLGLFLGAPTFEIGLVLLISNGTKLKFNANSLLSVTGPAMSLFNSSVFTNNNIQAVINCNEMLSTTPNDDPVGYGVWWRAGKLAVNCPHIFRGLQSIASECNNASYGDFYVTTETIEISNPNQPGYAAIGANGIDPSAAAWITCKTVRGATNTPAISNFGTNANKLYVTAQKVYGYIYNQNGLLYVDSQKHSAIDNQPMIHLRDGTSFINIQHSDSSGCAGCLFSGAGGTGHIQIGSYTSTNVSKGVVVSGGLLNLKNSRINTVQNNNISPITKYGGTLILKNTDLISNSGVYSISGNNQTIKSYGFNMANTDVAPAISLSPIGGFTVDNGVI